MRKLLFIPFILLLGLTSCYDKQDFIIDLQKNKNIDVIFSIPNTSTQFITINFDGGVNYVDYSDVNMKSSTTIVKRGDGTSDFTRDSEITVDDSYSYELKKEEIKGRYRTYEITDIEQLQITLNQLKHDGIKMEFVKVVPVGYSEYRIYYID